MARHQNRRKSVEKEPDYDFKTKRQIVVEQEYAPEPEMEEEMGICFFLPFLLYP